MKTKVWILLIGIVLLVCVALSALLLWPGEATTAQVYSDGELVYTLDLRIDQVKTVESKYGTNIITVKGGKIAVTEADCPDGYCMERGFCSGGAQIVCLPNRLVLHFIGQSDVDFVVG